MFSRLILSLLVAAAAAATGAAELSLERIMADPDWLGRQPENPYWADDGRSVYFERKVAGSQERRLHQVALDGTALREYGAGERHQADFRGGVWSADRRLKAYARNGDLFVKDVDAGVVRQLTRTAAEDADPRFMAGDDRIRFRRDGQIFVRELDSGLEYQPVVLRFEEDPDAQAPDTYHSRQQARLLQHVRERKADEQAERARDRTARRSDPTRVPEPVYLGDAVALKAAELSPDGRFMLLVLMPEDPDAKIAGQSDEMPDFVTESGYVEHREVRALVGTGAPRSDQVILLDLADHERHEVSFAALPGIHEDPLADLRRRQPDQGGAADGEHEADGRSGEPFTRAVEVASGGRRDERRGNGIHWSDDGTALVLQVFSHDHKDRWITRVDLADGHVETLHRMTDPAWINWDMNQLGFLRGTTTLYFTSEESGYSQLYTLALPEPRVRRLTEGTFVVSNVVQSPDGQYLYYEANPVHPGSYDVYRHDLRAARSEAVTDLGGLNDFVLSPDGTRLLVSHSTTTRPPELHVQRARPGAEPARLTSTVSDAFLAIDWVEPEIVPIPSSHQDRPIYSRVYGRGAAPGVGPRPAVVFVHGAGYLQNAHHGWSRYFREFMFHSLLVQQGYVVLDMDYRASAGYGRDWRTAIYRQMGTPELEDLRDGVHWLVQNANVDGARVGVYGGSYGGFMTLMALFKAPDLFAAGAALRPVTDWAHYSQGYSGRILNRPDVDPEAYARSSPIEFAEGLSAPLLIAHGMRDDNVFFKDSVRLVQRLIELQKTGWESAIYPVEPHAFREPSSWLDEYRRIYALFERHLQ